MARYRKRSKPLWITVPLWTGLIATSGWGLWQFAAFRHTLVAQAQQPPAPDAATVFDPAPAGRITPTSTSRSIADDPAIDGPVTTLTPSAPPLAPPVRIGPPPNLDDLLAKGHAFLDAGRIVEARTALNTALSLLTDDPRADLLREQLTALNTNIFLGTAILPEDPAARYVDIQQGDSFLKLGHQYKVPAQFLEDINPNLDPRNLKITSGVKIVRGPFNLRLVKHAARVDLYAREIYVRSFAAQLEDGNFLPRGAYRVTSGSKIDLGTRKWIGFEGIEPATRDISVGWLYGSAGMRGAASADDHLTGIKFDDPDLEQLYTVLVETHSVLRVVP